MNLQTKKILGINVTTSTKGKILEEIQEYFEKTRNSKLETRKNDVKPLVIFTPNPEIISYAQKDDKFKQIVNTAQINLPDGAGIVWAVKKLYGLEIKRIAGADFMEDLVSLAAKDGLTIGLIGGKGDLADVTAECLRREYPQSKIEVLEGPEIEISNIKNQKSTDEKYFETLAKELVDRKIDILFVALGHPKQEYFIDILNSYFLIHNSRPIVLMAVGGAFDYISSRVPRAPTVMRNLGIEWLFRLLREPWRLPRQLKGIEFFRKVILKS